MSVAEFGLTIVLAGANIVLGVLSGVDMVRLHLRKLRANEKDAAGKIHKGKNLYWLIHHSHTFL